MKFFLIFCLTLTLIHGKNIRFEILGSGGPEIDGRASTSYLLWIDDKAKLLIDLGSGSMLRFEQSSAATEDLDAVVLTHMHIDHSADLPSFMKAGFFTNRQNSLDIVGPYGNNYFPSIREFVEILFGKKGAYRYMQDILTSQSDSFELIPIEIAKGEKKTLRYKDFTLNFITVHHGIVPALALRIDVGSKSIVISGDTNDEQNTLERFAYRADLFIAHHAIPQETNNFAKELHMTPSTIANIAVKAQVKKIVLTHRMKRTKTHEEETLKLIHKDFSGDVIFAEDRMKIDF
ncbi:MBL fold metallo-hydrolase [Sulfurimonas crateris]|uniref:MBL fold metallo-hydrolase n=1 Tax=Sulfurimonas crateris TaxID=2574727 RepID=A0A4U2Z410_9BACT|nr:MBL fold metallo-hydrolase [Sulfurimonas crateris]TKI68475.1 MBL fold metallo-hydrolase [Sulfurimonas crateris]